MAREWLVRARNAKGLSQAEVAKQSGIVQQSYQLIERGENRPRPETAMRIGAVLGVPWVRFFEDGKKWGDGPGGEEETESVNVDALRGGSSTGRQDSGMGLGTTRD